MPGEVVDLIAVREGVLRQRKERLRTLAAAWFAAREYFLENPEKGAELMAPRLSVSAAEMLSSMKLLKLPCAAENREMLRPSGTLLASFQRVHEVMNASGQFAAAAPSAALMTDEVLP
jgi:NitT/TauT family transport system substrate-binding protein